MVSVTSSEIAVEPSREEQPSLSLREYRETIDVVAVVKGAIKIRLERCSQRLLGLANGSLYEYHEWVHHTIYAHWAHLCLLEELHDAQSNCSGPAVPVTTSTLLSIVGLIVGFIFVPERFLLHSSYVLRGPLRNASFISLEDCDQ